MIYPLIGLMGPAGAGKSTVAKLFARYHGYSIKSFADGVRDELATAIRKNDFPFGCPKFEMPNDVPAETLVYSKPTPRDLRAALQWWGTDYRRREDIGYWLKSIYLHPYQPTVIDDVRFYNEALFVLAHGGTLVLVRGRQAEGVPAHASENWATVWRMLQRLHEAETHEWSLDLHSPGHIIPHFHMLTCNNTGTLEELASKVKVLERLAAEHTLQLVSNV